MPNQTDGSWNSLQDWPLIGLHAIVMDDGKVFTFGTDSNGMQGGQFIYDIYDPATGQHTTLQNTTPTDIFCSAAVIIPGTNKILIAGGDARPLGSVNRGVADVNILDMDTGILTPAPNGDMAFQRWYPTMLSLPTGQMVMLGGSDINGQGIATPEIYTHGVGWKSLTGAVDGDIARSPSYPRSFVDGDGNIIYFATGLGGDNQVEVMSLDPSGNGSLAQVATVPFNVAWDAPAVMYEAGKVLIQDAQTGLWSMDISGDTPQFTKVATLSQERNWSNMTTLADGTVLINGGTSNGNAEAGSDHTAVIWDPNTNQLNYTVDEDNPRLYHSASVLLNDGTLLSLGGGAAGSSEHNFLDGQIYKPPYLYDANGNLADRPVITVSPDNVNPGDTFSITLDDAADIQKLTFVKTGAATHAFNMDARSVELEFTVGADNALSVTMPGLAEGVTAGSWMLFAWDSQGVPSIAPLVSVNPDFGSNSDDPDNMLLNGGFETAADVQDSGIHDYVFGWESSVGKFEIWENGFQGVSATDKTLTEIDAGQGTISQQVSTKLDLQYDLSFEFTGRPGQIASSSMEVLWNGAVIATITPTDSMTTRHDVMVTGTGGKDALAFRSIAGDDDGFGGLLDQVVLKPSDDEPVENGNVFKDVADENQSLTGTSDNDIFVIDGNSGDYGWGETQDGLGIVVWRGEKFDILSGFESIRFNDTTISLVPTSDVYTDIPNVTQFIHGTSAEESFVINGDSKDYGWGPTQDDQGIVVWGETGFDLLFGVEKLVFNDKEISLETSNPNEGRTVEDDPDRVQFEKGGAEHDKFVINDASDTYGWGLTNDGNGVVVWNNQSGGFDILTDFDEIVFDDLSVDITGIPA